MGLSSATAEGIVCRQMAPSQRQSKSNLPLKKSETISRMEC